MQLSKVNNIDRFDHSNQIIQWCKTNGSSTHHSYVWYNNNIISRVRDKIMAE